MNEYRVHLRRPPMPEPISGVFYSIPVEHMAVVIGDTHAEEGGNLRIYRGTHKPPEFDVQMPMLAAMFVAGEWTRFTVDREPVK